MIDQNSHGTEFMLLMLELMIGRANGTITEEQAIERLQQFVANPPARGFSDYEPYGGHKSNWRGNDRRYGNW